MSSSSSIASSSNPTIRSRTLLFISYRDSRASSSRFKRRVLFNYDESNPDGDEEDRLIEPDAGHVSIDAELPPQWYVLSHSRIHAHLIFCLSLLRVEWAAQVEDILVGTQAKSTSVISHFHTVLFAPVTFPGLLERFNVALLSYLHTL